MPVDISRLSFCLRQSSPNSMDPFILFIASSRVFFSDKAEELVAYPFIIKNCASGDNN